MADEKEEGAANGAAGPTPGGDTAPDMEACIADKVGFTGDVSADDAAAGPLPPKSTTPVPPPPPNAADGEAASATTGGSGAKRKRASLTGKSGAGAIDLAADAQQQQLALLAAAHRTRKDSLRLSASRIAALTGFNPYADLPNLILDLVYQGYAGQLLLSQDARLLGMELVSRDTAMEELLAKAATSATEVAKTAKDKAEAKEIQTAVQQIAQIQRGEAKPPSTVASATKMKTQTLAKISEVQKKLPKTSKAKLSAGEAKMLSESVRSVVDTNFGTHHENEALDLYEQRYGCEVRERNEGIYCLDFVRGEEDDASSGTGEATAVPVGLAKKLYDNTSRNSNDGESNAMDMNADCIDLTDDVDNSDEEKEKAGPKEKSSGRPYFCILGSIDGIRDELCYAPPAGEVSAASSASGSAEASGHDDEKEIWMLKPIVVECKHRMRKLYNPPPLYDQIQSTVYCLMRGTDEADLVQVLRSEKKRKVAKPRKKEARDDEPAKPQPQLTDFGYVVESKAIGEHDGNGNATGESKSGDKEDGSENGPEIRPTNAENDKVGEVPRDAKPTQGEDEKLPRASDTNTTTELNILVTRIKMDDQATQHRSNFQSVVLPRLRSIVDAIYTIRSDDDKRYRFLVNATSSDIDAAARKIALESLFTECPWLRHCDISHAWRA